MPNQEVQNKKASELNSNRVKHSSTSAWKFLDSILLQDVFVHVLQTTTLPAAIASSGPRRPRCGPVSPIKNHGIWLRQLLRPPVVTTIFAGNYSGGPAAAQARHGKTWELPRIICWGCRRLRLACKFTGAAPHTSFVNYNVLPNSKAFMLLLLLAWNSRGFSKRSFYVSFWLLAVMFVMSCMRAVTFYLGYLLLCHCTAAVLSSLLCTFCHLLLLSVTLLLARVCCLFLVWYLLLSSPRCS